MFWRQPYRPRALDLQQRVASAIRYAGLTYSGTVGVVPLNASNVATRSARQGSPRICLALAPQSCRKDLNPDGHNTAPDGFKPTSMSANVKCRLATQVTAGQEPQSFAVVRPLAGVAYLSSQMRSTANCYRCCFTGAQVLEVRVPARPGSVVRDDRAGATSSAQHRSISPRWPCVSRRQIDCDCSSSSLSTCRRQYCV